MARNNTRNTLFDRAAVVLLAATGLVCLCYLILFILPASLNPLAPPTPIKLAQLPTPKPSPTGPLPTPSATPPPTIPPTNTRLPTLTPRKPTNTPRPTYTPPPTRTPTETYGPSVTPSPTRSKYPFVGEVFPQVAPWGCTWAGIMGGVYDLEGLPIAGYLVHVEGDAGIDVVIPSGNSEFSKAPGFDASSWSVAINANGPTAGVWRVRLYMPGTNAPISDVYEVRLEALCGASSYFVKFTQNH
jgi:hypothetical protein